MQQPELGKTIAELRKEKGLTQEELIKLCHLSIRTLQRIESGEVFPRNYTVKAIFKALDYSPETSVFTTKTDVLEYSPSKANVGFKHALQFILNMFNLKTNTMKKVSILTAILLMIFLSFNLKSIAQSLKSNPLAGNWKLVGEGQKPFTLNDLTYKGAIKITDISTIRYLEFKTDFRFESRNSDNTPYNEGCYSVINDSTWITIHIENDGNPSTVSNLYRYKISNDTLHFWGFYMASASDLCENCYKKAIIDEWWVKIKKEKK